MLATIVICLVVNTVCFKLWTNLIQYFLICSAQFVKWKIQNQRTNLRTKEVVRAACTQRSQFIKIVAADKFKHTRIIRKVTDHRLLLRSKSAQIRRQLTGN